MIPDTTIAAIATPLQSSAIGIIRISGPQSLQRLSVFFNKDPQSVQTRQVYTGFFRRPDNTPIDECCYVYYESPQSYTGEDMVEIFSHGNPYILKEIMGALCADGTCQIAKNGEFTKRAFLNGKMPITKAESVQDIIESTNESSLSVALSQYNGHVYNTIRTLRENLMACLEKVEASLEFPDEVGPITGITDELGPLYTDISRIVATSDYGHRIKTGVTFLIIGEPNVGKSSLLNALSGEDRSIVTNVAGTTRDYVDIDIQYKGIHITLIDTAGIRATKNEIEQLGINKINALSDRAFGYIMVHDATTPTTDDSLTAHLDPNKPIIHVYNKCDLKPDYSNKHTSPDVYTSCHTGHGLIELKDGLIESISNGQSVDHDSMVCNIRQLNALKLAHHHLNAAITNITQQHTLDIIAIDIRDTISSLSDLMGDTFTEELLDGIFSNFCIGK